MCEFFVREAALSAVSWLLYLTGQINDHTHFLRYSWKKTQVGCQLLSRQHKPLQFLENTEPLDCGTW